MRQNWCLLSSFKQFVFFNDIDYNLNSYIVFCMQKKQFLQVQLTEENGLYWLFCKEKYQHSSSVPLIKF